MTAREAVAYLAIHGYSCSIGTVRALANTGKLKHYRPGLSERGKMQFREVWLDEFLRAAELGGDHSGAEAPAKPLRTGKATAVPRKPIPPPIDWLAEFEKAAAS